MGALAWRRTVWIAGYFGVVGAAACSDGPPQIYGPAYDGGDGGDATSDVVVDSPATQEGGPRDAGSDAPPCTSTIALLGGNATTIFGAGGQGFSGLSAQGLPGGLLDCGTDFACGIPAAIVPVGTGLLGVLAAAADAGTLESTSYASGWSAKAVIPSALATIDGPSLAVVSGSVDLVYQGADYKYYRAQYTQSWSPVAEAVGGIATQSYGPRAPSGAAAGADLVTVQAGADGYLYTQDYSGGAWQTAAKNGSAAVQNTIPPAIIALSGGSSELLAAYLRITDYKIMSVDRQGGTWSTSPVQVDVNAYTDDPLALAPLPGGKALLVYRGSDKKPYFSVWNGSSWSVPAAALGASNPSIASAPSAAGGVCGADAVVAWAQSTGGVVVVPFRAGAFESPQSVAGTSGAKFVAVGTLP